MTEPGTTQGLWWVTWAAGVLIIARLSAQLWLEWLNRRSVKKHAHAIPEPFRQIVDAPTYAKSVQYTLAGINLRRVEVIWGCLVLCVLLFSGVLPKLHAWFVASLGSSAWAMALFLFTTGFLLSLPSLPLDWYDQFHLEERFGFNTSTAATWWLDRLKGFGLAAILGLPLLTLILKLVEWTGNAWWLWAWASVLAFQLVMAVLAPIVIMPLFNKFFPLEDEALRDRLSRLAEKTGFRARSIEVMDGSRRSRHSNAFFTGFGRFRKIVLFDTLVQQLTPVELEAVLAHEIGHYRRRHIPKLLLFSAVASLAGFFVLSFLAKQDWLYKAFGFQTESIVPALLLFSLLSGTVTFWFSPLMHWWTRRYEYEADEFAAKVMNEGSSLKGALRKLSEKNLSNLTPHAIYSGFYYSHPTLLERERALDRLNV